MVGLYAVYVGYDSAVHCLSDHRVAVQQLGGLVMRAFEGEERTCLKECRPDMNFSTIVREAWKESRR